MKKYIALGLFFLGCGGSEEPPRDGSVALDAASDATMANDGAMRDGSSGAPCSTQPSTLPDLEPRNADDLQIREISLGNYIELFNPTDTAIDLGNKEYRLCVPFLYISLATTNSTTMVPAGGSAVIEWPYDESVGDDPSGDEVILFADNDFENPDKIIDFVCWGSGRRSSRKTQAETGNKWSGPCAAEVTTGAIQRTPSTDGTAANAYETDAPPGRGNCTF